MLGLGNQWSILLESNQYMSYGYTPKKILKDMIVCYISKLSLSVKDIKLRH